MIKFNIDRFLENMKQDPLLKDLVPHFDKGKCQKLIREANKKQKINARSKKSEQSIYNSLEHKI